MKGGFRTLLRKFCLECTILGPKYFYLYPDLVSRCFWLANMVGVLSLACLLSILLYNRFTEMPTRFTIENQYEPVKNFPYPSITLCSPNQMTQSFLTHFNKTLVDGNLTIDVGKALSKLLNIYDMDETDLKEMVHLQSLLDANRYTVSEIVTGLPQSCESFLKLCFFNNVKQTSCSTLFRPILTVYGLCCAFNNVYSYHFRDRKNVRDHNFIPINVTLAGHKFGLTVVTDYNPEDAFDGSIQLSGTTKVMYTDYTEFPSEDETSLLETSVETYNTIHATYTYLSEDVKSLPVWSRKCYMEDEHRLPHFGNYHNSDCDLLCFTTAVYKNCHCIIPYMPHSRIEYICNLTSIDCIIKTKGRMAELLPQCNCPRDCERRHYKVDINVGNLNAFQHMVYNPYADIKFNQSTSIRHFFFRSAVYVKQKQETVMSIITFMSNLGGVFGLCLGCSGISVLEIVFYIYVVLKNYIKRKLDRKSVKTFH